MTALHSTPLLPKFTESPSVANTPFSRLQTLTATKLSDTLALRFSGTLKTAEATLDVPRKEHDLSNVKIFSGRSNPKLAEEVARYLGTTLGQVELGNFKNGENKIRFQEEVEGRDVFLIQSTSTPVNENLMELLQMVDALKREHARSITVVMPHYGYARQDNRNGNIEPVSAKLVADLLKQAGATRAMIMDGHSKQLEGFFDMPVESLAATALTAGYLRLKNIQNAVIVSPDEGGVKRAKNIAKVLGLPYAVVDKDRVADNQVESGLVIGDVKGKVAIIVDDMIDTAGTLKESAQKLKEAGAEKIIALATHPILSGAALENLENSVIDEVVVTDTIPLTPEAQKLNKISQITIAPILGEAIGQVVDNFAPRETAPPLGTDTLDRIVELVLKKLTNTSQKETHETPPAEKKSLFAKFQSVLSGFKNWLLGLFKSCLGFCGLKKSEGTKPQDDPA